MAFTHVYSMYSSCSMYSECSITVSWADRLDWRCYGMINWKTYEIRSKYFWPDCPDNSQFFYSWAASHRWETWGCTPPWKIAVSCRWSTPIRSQNSLHSISAKLEELSPFAVLRRPCIRTYLAGYPSPCLRLSLLVGCLEIEGKISSRRDCDSPTLPFASCHYRPIVYNASRLGFSLWRSINFQLIAGKWGIGRV